MESSSTPLKNRCLKIRRLRLNMIPQDKAAFRIVSAFPGRVRIQLLNEHGNSELLRQLDARLAAIEAVTETDVVAEANSVTVRYETTQRDLAAVVRAIEMSAAAIISGQSRSSAPLDGVEPFAKHVGRACISPSSSISVLHSFPGRVRLSIPQLRRQRTGAAYLESGLMEERGINSVETFFNEAFIVVRYDAKFHHAAAVVGLVERLLAMPVQSPADQSAIVRAHDMPLNQSRLPNALLVSTAAVALAATGQCRSPSFGWHWFLQLCPWRSALRRAHVICISMSINWI